MRRQPTPVLLAAALLLGACPLFAAGTKSGGNVVISDDLHGGSAGSVGLTGTGGVSLDGSIGQTATTPEALDLPSGTTVESGFFSRMVSQSTSVTSQVSLSSASFAWSDGLGGNPLGTSYHIDLSTASDFSGVLFSSVVYNAFAGQVPNLQTNTTYFARLIADYMEGDSTQDVTGLNPYVTLASAPVAELLTSVGPNGFHAEWDGQNPTNDPTGFVSAASLPAARQGLAAATYGRYVYAAGGRNGSVVNTVYYARVQSDGTIASWQTATALPAPRELLAMVAWGGKLFALGGSDGTSPSTSTWSAPILSDGSLGAWTATTPLPTKLYKHAAAVWDGTIFVTGGDNGVVPVSSVYYAAIRSDGSLGPWNTGTSLSAARSGHAMAISSGTLFVVGGVTGNGVEATVLSNTLNGDVPASWVQISTSLPGPRTGEAVVAANGNLLLFGGNDGSSTHAEAYIAKMVSGGQVDAWRQLSLALPTPLWLLAGVNANENIIMLGGSDGSLPQSRVSDASPSGTQYIAEASQDPLFASGVSSSTWSTDFSFDWSGLQPDTTYYARVRARNYAGIETAIIPLGSTRTLAAIPGAVFSSAPPRPFSDVELSSITVVWFANGNPGTVQFQAVASTSPDLSAPIASGWGTGLTDLFTGLSVNTSYYFGVQARDSSASQQTSPMVSLGARFTLSSAPVNTQIVAAQPAGFTLQWSTGNLPGWTVFEAQASTSATFDTLAASSQTLSNTISFSGLPSAATFYARVRSINGNGIASGFDAVVSTTTSLDLTPPGVSTNVAAAPSGTADALVLSWTAPGDDGYSGTLRSGSTFYVQWSTADPALVAWSTASAQIAIATGPVTAGASSSILVSGLPAETTASFRVWTNDASGNYSLPSSTASAFVSPFAFSTVDASNGSGPSIAVDRFGNLHVAYHSNGVGLRYAKRSGGSWTVGQQPDPGVTVGELAIAVDNDGNPQIAYHDTGTSRIKIARYNGSSWSASVVDSGNLALGGLALDTSGHAQLSYTDVTNGAVKFSSWTGVAWASSTVASASGLSRLSAVALSAAQTPYVLYSVDSPPAIVVASATSSGWSTQSWAALAASSAPAIAVAGDGRIFVSYLDPASAQLFVASATSGGAISSVSVGNGGIAASGGLALDGAGRPVVAYYKGGRFSYGRLSGAGWVFGAIDYNGVVGGGSSLAIDGSGDVAAVYSDGTSGSLKLAQWTGGVTAPAGGNAGSEAQAPSAMAGTAASVSQIQWTWTDNAGDEQGFALYGSTSATGPFQLVKSSATAGLGASAGTGVTVSFTESGLASGTTYYRYVVAVTSGGVAASKVASAYPFNTLDVSSPTINDLQAGDTTWRKLDSGLYAVHFLDSGGSHLAQFQVAASTVPGGAGPNVIGFTTVVNSINADTYNNDWALPASVFNALWEGVTNYISVKAIDGVGNSTVAVDAFFVLKDTTAPTITNGEAGGDNVIHGSSGTAYPVYAADAASRLYDFQYSASTSQASGDASVVPWTSIALVNGSTGYSTPWPVAFSLLAGGTNYISVRAFDVAGNTSTVTDAFYVLKATVGPTVGITAPAAPYVSSLATIAGTAANPFGVKGVEVAVGLFSGGSYLYWDGTAFTSAQTVFFAATGGGSWQYSPGIAWATGSQYDVVARASDTAGNYSATYATSTFVFDASTPTVAVVTPAPNSAISALSSISGTAADNAGGAGVASVQVELRRNSDGMWWNWFNDNWTSLAVSTVATGTTNWSVSPDPTLQASLTSNTSYFIAVRASDLAQPSNQGDFFAQGSTFTWSDTTPPAAVTNLTASSSTVSGRVDLSWTAPGNDGNSGVILNGYLRIQYSTFTPVNWSSAAAQIQIATANVVPGTLRGFSLTNLIAGVTYYSVIWNSDSNGNWSGVSNVASVMAGPPLNNSIAGQVVKVSSEGITAVQVECFDSNNTLISSTFTVADGSGSFRLDNIPQGLFKIQASWSANGIISSVWQDNIPMGASTVVFVLNLDYTLAALTGTMQAMAAPQSVSSGANGFLTMAQGNNYTTSKVELYTGGRLAVVVPVQPNGRWLIPNLLPGKYGVRAYNGVAYTDIVEVNLAEGELKQVGFVYSPLPDGSVFAFPNPARNSTTIRFISPLAPLDAQVMIFDLAGQLVREIPGSEMTSPALGLYHAPWDLTNSRGEPVASGVYLFVVKVKGGDQNQIAKVVKKLAVVR